MEVTQIFFSLKKKILAGQIKIENQTPKETLVQLEEALVKSGLRESRDNKFVFDFTSQLITTGNFFGNFESTVYKVKVLEKDTNPVNIKW